MTKAELETENAKLKEAFLRVIFKATDGHYYNTFSDGVELDVEVENLKALLESKPCPSTYTHSSLGKLACEKDEAHLYRSGDVEHRRGQTIWMSV